jgi:hypothetical protein
LLVVCDPRTDHQAITEASYVNIPVIAFCNTDSPLKLSISLFLETTREPSRLVCFGGCWLVRS